MAGECKPGWPTRAAGGGRRVCLRGVVEMLGRERGCRCGKAEALWSNVAKPVWGRMASWSGPDAAGDVDRTVRAGGICRDDADQGNHGFFRSARGVSIVDSAR